MLFDPLFCMSERASPWSTGERQIWLRLGERTLVDYWQHRDPQAFLVKFWTTKWPWRTGQSSGREITIGIPVRYFSLNKVEAWLFQRPEHLHQTSIQPLPRLLVLILTMYVRATLDSCINILCLLRRPLLSSKVKGVKLTTTLTTCLWIHRTDLPSLRRFFFFFFRSPGMHTLVYDIHGISLSHSVDPVRYLRPEAYTNEQPPLYISLFQS